MGNRRLEQLVSKSDAFRRTVCFCAACQGPIVTFQPRGVRKNLRVYRYCAECFASGEAKRHHTKGPHR